MTLPHSRNIYIYFSVVYHLYFWHNASQVSVYIQDKFCLKPREVFFKNFSYLSKTFLSLFSSLVRYFEKWVVNFQISYFKNSNLNCFLVFFVLVRHTQSTKNYLSFLYIQHLKLRIVKLPKTLLLKFHVFKFKWKSNSGVVGTKERYIKPEKWFWRNVMCLMPGFLILHISYKQRVSFI